jgi:hypothetical protein
MKRNAAPILAATLLLLPVVYVGSYFAVVMPGCEYEVTIRENERIVKTYPPGSYRIGDWAKQLYWPLEQIDRKLRPHAWFGDAFH